MNIHRVVVILLGTLAAVAIRAADSEPPEAAAMLDQAQLDGALEEIQRGRRIFRQIGRASCRERV